MTATNESTALLLAFLVLLSPLSAISPAEQEGIPRAGNLLGQNIFGHDNSVSRTLGKVEDISGNLESFDSRRREILIITDEGIPYVFVLTQSSKIVINGSAANISLLAAQMRQKADVRFIPRSNGNLVLRIAVMHW